MRSSLTTCFLGGLLSLSLLACQQPTPLQEPVPVASASRTGSFLFSGNPGVRTIRRLDISGSLSGTIGGQPIVFGSDKEFPVQATQGYNLYSRNPSYLAVEAQNQQYQIVLSFNGPFEAGRSYRVYNLYDDNGEGKFDAYNVQAFIRTGANFSTTQIVDLTKPDKQVRIKAITADYIDIAFDFTLKQAGATPERLTLRIKNVLDENQGLRTQSEGEPHWPYTNVDRQIEGWDYLPIPGGGPNLNGYPSPPTSTRVLIYQRQLTTPGTDFNYDGQTQSATSQWIALSQSKTTSEQVSIEYYFGRYGLDGSDKQVAIIWPNFKGVGIYTGDQVRLSFFNSLGTAGYWRVQPDKLSNATTKWLVNVQRVTADVIEGTYAIVDAPLYEHRGSMAMPGLVSVSGNFKVIYPR